MSIKAKTFQLRHRVFGLYQGSCLGLGFWYPLSETPEQGICEFHTFEEAEKFKTFLCTESESPLNPDDLSIEPFNSKLSERLIKEN